LKDTIKQKIITFIKQDEKIKNFKTPEPVIESFARFVIDELFYPYVDQLITKVDGIIEINPTLTEREILEKATLNIVDFLNASAASIRIFDPEKRMLISYGSCNRTESVREAAIPYDNTIAGDAIKKNETILVSDINREKRYIAKEKAFLNGINSMMAIPFTIPKFSPGEKDTQGVIQIYYKEKNKIFSLLELRTAEMMTRRVGFVIARKRIIGLQRQNETKERITKVLFDKLAHRETIKMRDVFKLIIPELAKIITIQSCVLFSVSPDGDSVILDAGYPEDDGHHGVGIQFDMTREPYFGVLINRTEPLGSTENEVITSSYILIKNPQRSNLLSPETKWFSINHHINSILYIPLIIDDKVKYFLAFDAMNEKEKFSEEEIEILSFFGKELSKAAKIERMDDIIHDFKNPAIAVAGFAKRVKRLVESNEKEIDKERLFRNLDILIKETQRMQDMAMSLHVEAKEEIVDLTEVLLRRCQINEEVIREMELVNIKSEIRDIEKGLWVRCYPLYMERIFDNLLHNATNAIQTQGQRGKIVIRSYKELNRGVVEISNTGEISEFTRDMILKGESRGRGLQIIFRLVNLMNGKIELLVKDGFTTFKVSFSLVKRHR